MVNQIGTGSPETRGWLVVWPDIVECFAALAYPLVAVVLETRW
jgi:hypothetical protein